MSWQYAKMLNVRHLVERGENRTNLENFIVWKFSQKTNRCEKSQMGVINEQFLKKQ